MSFGLETFDEYGNLDFSMEGNFRVLKRIRVFGNTSFTVNKPPPYKYIVLIDNTANSASRVSCTNSGNTVTVTYHTITNSVIGNSRNMPATVLVVK